MADTPTKKSPAPKARKPRSIAAAKPAPAPAPSKPEPLPGAREEQELVTRFLGATEEPVEVPAEAPPLPDDIQERHTLLFNRGWADFDKGDNRKNDYRDNVKDKDSYMAGWRGREHMLKHPIVGGDMSRADAITMTKAMRPS